MPRKRQREHQDVKEGIGGMLKGVSKRVTKGKFEDALILLDKTASQEKLSTSRQGQLAALAGDIEFKQGKFSSAYEIYQRAEILADGNVENGNNRVWFRAVIGQVRSLLKEVRVPEAYDIAQKAWVKATEKYEVHQQEIRDAQLKLQQNGGGVWVVQERPHRPSVIGARLGQLFFQEGELQSAKDFFLKAIDYNPQGGCRARIGLAQIALRENNFLEALLRANQALVMGKLSAKTLCAWPLYITARQRLGQKSVEIDLLNTLNKSKLKDVKARAILSIARTLRNYSDESWKAIAQDWLTKEGNSPSADGSIVSAELRKLLLSEAKVTNQNQEQVAEALLATEKISANEHLAATKTKLKVQLQQGETPEVSGWIEKGAKIYGSDFAGKLRHGLALIFWQSQQPESGRTLLEQNIQTLAKKDSQWSKSAWALGQLEETQNNYLKAAEYFNLVAKEQNVPLRFRLQATVNWAKNLVQTGEVELILTAKNEIVKMIQSMQDYKTFLDFARHLTYAPPELKEFRTQLIDEGTTLALKAYQEGSHPTTALLALHYLTRRQVYDFSQQEKILIIYFQSVQNKLNWLWQNRREFWEYLSFVYQAFCARNQSFEGDNWLKTFLQDSATSSEGIVILGVEYARHLILRGQHQEALSLFENYINQVPLHNENATSYYWLALKAWKKGQQSLTKQYASKIRLCLSSNAGLAREKRLEISALLFISDLNVSTALSKETKYSEELLTKEMEVIQKRLEKL